MCKKNDEKITFRTSIIFSLVKINIIISLQIVIIYYHKLHNI